jgi:circadian clock protein KaiC
MLPCGKGAREAFMVQAQRHSDSALPKAPTGIAGLDEITEGGLPRGRPTLVCGSAGCGKTLLASEFIVRGATQFGEPGVFLTFEETAEELGQNARSLGFDLDDLSARNLLTVDYVRVERSEIEETGEYDLEGLFVRLGYAIDTLGAKRVVLDTIEVLFGGLSNAAILRSEIRRLFRWLKDKGVTSVITAERGAGTLTRHGLEEYVSDCVILLDHRVMEQVSTRRLRIVKYRGSAHGTNEFPFLIDDSGISVVPITSAGMDHPASSERVSTGIAGLDDMLGGKGYFRGSSILVSGSAGTGKTSLAVHFAVAACARGERCLFASFEESPGQLVRNMRSIGLDLERWIKRGLLDIHSARPTRYGLEMHLAQIHKAVVQFEPRVAVVDPISNFVAAGTLSEAGSMMVRLIDHFKSRGITCLFTDLSRGNSHQEETEIGVSSIIDTWLVLCNTEQDAQRLGILWVVKSRGMAHSREMRRFLLTERGVELMPASGPAMKMGNRRQTLARRDKRKGGVR